MLRTSIKQQKAIRGTEAFRPKAYKDSKNPITGKQLYSIGYGHQIQNNENSLLSADISIAKAEQLFASDLAPLENLINSKCRIKPNQNQFDALVDFGYNCGEGALNKVISTYNSNPHNMVAVTDNMKLYNKTRSNNDGQLYVSTSLSSRRSDEADLFQSPVAKGAMIAAAGLVVGYMLLS
ncbi:lysozyme [Mucilaginibacter sp. 5C4]|uniref:lysozyme n=1 Tax=Mucilaginibacter sp. 5C4 TaxID=3048589 RepID=UPI002AC89FFB|nr:lysozyme [Mucilaginibacter sp. 5C4]MEB0302358.1 lysozyme [Mucilaginibacter sp. 5C4]WPX22150.1 lysozyme [Mucilaginibacter sp. 5C4]